MKAEYKLSAINTLTIEIEEDFSSQFSILAYDDYSDSEGGVWIERFAQTIEEAKNIAENLYNQIIKKY